MCWGRTGPLPRSLPSSAHVSLRQLASGKPCQGLAGWASWVEPSAGATRLVNVTAYYGMLASDGYQKLVHMLVQRKTDPIGARLPALGNLVLVPESSGQAVHYGP